jgi:hypothetical protein
MGLRVTLSGDVGKYLLRGAIWELGAYSYRADVHLVPSAPRLDLSEAVVLVSVRGSNLQGVLDAATARAMTAIGKPVQNLQVRAAPRNAEVSNVRRTAPHPFGAA